MSGGLHLAVATAAFAFIAPPASGSEAPPASSPREPAARDTVFVDATDRLTFRPDSVVVRVGDVVTWRSAGLIQHSVTADPAEATMDGSVRLPAGAEPFDSGLLAEGETFSRTFRLPGTYDYFCIPHEGAGMTGTVIVIDDAHRTNAS